MSNKIDVQIVVFGGGTCIAEVFEGTTIAEALAQEGISQDQKSLVVNGNNVTDQHRLQRGDDVNVVPEVKGG